MRKLTTLVTILFFVATSLVNAQVAQLQSMFIYNFTKQIEWPPAYRQGEFVIGVLGNSQIVAELSKLAQTKTVGSQRIVVKKFTTAKAIEKCHILFVSQDASSSTEKAVEKITENSFNTLIIGEQEGLTQSGAAINFVIRDRRQNFELKKANAAKYGLKISAYIEKLAIIVP